MGSGAHHVRKWIEGTIMKATRGTAENVGPHSSNRDPIEAVRIRLIGQVIIVRWQRTYLIIVMYNEGTQELEVAGVPAM